jgi:glucokinase
MSSKKVIGLDIGGTKIHLGTVQNGNILNELKLPTAAQASKEHIIKDITKGIKHLMDADIAGIGIGVAGLVDEQKGIVYGVQNIPSFQEVHLKAYLENHFGIPVYLTNDANSFVLGEKLYGRGQYFSNMVGLTLGTGLGGGIILNNQLCSGTLSSAGEFGGIPYLDKTVEDYCSGKFFVQQFGLSGSDVFARLEQGQEQARQIMQQFGQHLGNVIKIILFSLSPEAIFFGGSVSNCYPYFEEAMRASLQDFPFKQVKEQLVLERSTLDNAAILGAAALVHIKSKDLKSMRLV